MITPDLPITLSQDLSPALARNLVLGIPLLALTALALLLTLRDPDRLRERAPLALLGAVVVGTALAAAHAIDPLAALWEFAPAPVTLEGMPVEAWLGWTILWGALPGLAGGAWWGWLAGFVWADLLLMPALGPMVRLQENWLLGEAVLLLCVAAPTLLLLEATRSRRWLWFRVVVQGTTFTALIVWGVGSAGLAAGGQTWADVVDHPLPLRAGLLLLFVIVALPGGAAVAELARVGAGTPYPWDPPERLVTTGPYAYLANPMQFGMVGVLLVLALAAGSWRLAGAALVGAAFCHAIAEPHEVANLGRRWPGHAAWRAGVRNWIPRWRPVVVEPAALWVSESCALCAATGDTLQRLRLTGLARCAAEDASVRLTRMRWSNGVTHDSGTRALGRALEHGNLLTAWWGWLLRLPVMATFVQLAADAGGLGPTDLPRGPRP